MRSMVAGMTLREYARQSDADNQLKERYDLLVLIKSGLPRGSFLDCSRVGSEWSILI